MSSVSEKCMDIAYFNRDFQRRVEYFRNKAAVAVMGEVTPVGDEHTARVAYADRVMGGNANIKQFCVGVVNNSTIAANIDAGVEPVDNDMEFTVNSIFSKYAGWDQ